MQQRVKRMSRDIGQVEKQESRYHRLITYYVTVVGRYVLYSEAPRALPWLSRDISPVCTKPGDCCSVLDRRPELPKTLDPKPLP